MSNHITPTIGRIVYYRGENGQVRAAVITQVNGDFNLNLYVFPTGFTDADCCTKESVTHADPAIEPACFPSWHWMPYQVEQAKKADQQLIACSVGAVGYSSDPSYVRAQSIEMALRTPNGSQSYREIPDAAKAYEQYLRGE